MSYRNTYGVGLPTSFLNSHARTGHHSPSSYHATKGHEKIKDSVHTYSSAEGEITNIEEIEEPKKDMKPLLTRKGKFIATAIILGYVIYRVYKSHLASSQQVEVKENGGEIGENNGSANDGQAEQNTNTEVSATEGSVNNVSDNE